MIEIETRNTRQSISSEHELNTVIIHAMSSCYVVMLCYAMSSCYVVVGHSRQATIPATHLTSYVFSKHYKLCLPEKDTKTLDNLCLSEKNSKTLDKLTSGKELQNTRQVISSGKELPNTRQAMSSGKQLKTVDKLSSGPEVQHTHNKLEHCGRRSKQSTISHVFSTRTQSISYILREGSQVIRQAMSSGHELETVDKLSSGLKFNARHRDSRSNQSTVS